MKKNNLAHTGIQWTTGTGGCVELWQDVRPDVLRSVTPTCGALRGSIERAVRDGRLPVPDGGPAEDHVPGDQSVPLGDPAGTGHGRARNRA